MQGGVTFNFFFITKGDDEYILVAIFIDSVIYPKNAFFKQNIGELFNILA